MKWLVLLVIAGLVTASDLKLGDRIYATEKECNRIKKLNENWTTANYHEEATQYVDLYIICADSLNEDKRKYIHDNKVDLTWFPDIFKIETSDGEKSVTKPPPKHSEVLSFDSAKKIMARYITKEGGKLNPIYRHLHIQSERGQDIVDKQVECEELGLVALKQPDNTTIEAIHDKCLTQLYCMKERFMEQRHFTRQHYREYFPILYKQKGIMMKTPPTFDKSVCEGTETVKGSRKELEKWISGIEVIGEKLANIGEAGTDFIDKLLKKGAHGGDKVLTREELSDLLENAASVTVSDGAEYDADENKKVEHKSTLKVYGDLLADKLAELEARGVKIAYKELDKAKPTIEKVENIAQAGKQVIKGMKHGENEDEDSVEESSSSEKEEGSSLSQMLTPNFQSDEKEETTLNTDSGKVDDGDETKSESSSHSSVPKVPTPLQILKDISGTGEKEEIKLTESELRKTLEELKENTEKKLEANHLSKKDVLESAEIVKNVINTLLTAAGQGYGAAKDMVPQEIEKAKSLVNELVNYATIEILGDKHKDADQEDEEDDDDEEAGDDLDKRMPLDEEAQKSANQDQTTTSATQNEGPIQDQGISNQDGKNEPTAQNETKNENQNVIPNLQDKDTNQLNEEGKDNVASNLDNELKPAKQTEEVAAPKEEPPTSSK